jgi:hypothetical protein
VKLSDNIELIPACTFKDDNNHKIERYLLAYSLDEEDIVKCCTLDVLYLEDSERVTFSDDFWEDFTKVERFEVRYLLDKNINKILYKE